MIRVTKSARPGEGVTLAQTLGHPFMMWLSCLGSQSNLGSQSCQCLKDHYTSLVSLSCLSFQSSLDSQPGQCSKHHHTSLDSWILNLVNVPRIIQPLQSHYLVWVLNLVKDQPLCRCKAPALDLHSLLMSEQHCPNANHYQIGRSKPPV